MKRIVALFVILTIVCSLFTTSGYAESESEELSNVEVLLYTIIFAEECYNRNFITDAQRVSIVSTLDLDRFKNEGTITEPEYILLSAAVEKILSSSTAAAAPTQTSYSFGQGTFIVGQDIKAGTYDITCKSASDEGLSSSISEFSDIYSSYGMDDYANMFGSLGSMYDSMSGMSVTIYKNGGGYDKHLTLKVDETASIILEDGGRLELSDGTAELTWIR